MRTHIIGNRIEIDGALVAVLNEAAYAGRHLDLVDLLDRAGEDRGDDLAKVEDTLNDVAREALAVSKGIDDIAMGEAGTVPALLRRMSATIDGLKTHDNEPLDDAIAGVRDVLDSVVAWLDGLARAPVTPAVTDATDAATKLPLVEAALETANARVTEMAAEVVQLRGDLDGERANNRALTSNAGTVSHQMAVLENQCAAYRVKNQVQADEIKRLTNAAAKAAKASPAPAVPGTVRNQMGFDAAAARLYLHLQGQAHKLDTATAKLVLAVGKTL